MATTVSSARTEEAGNGNGGKHQAAMQDQTPVKDKSKLKQLRAQKLRAQKHKMSTVVMPTEKQWEYSCRQDPEWALELMDKRTIARNHLQQQAMKEQIHPRMAKLKSEWHPAGKKEEAPLLKIGVVVPGNKNNKNAVNLFAARRAKKMNRMQGTGFKRTFGGAQFKITPFNSEVEPLLCGIFRQMKNKQPLCMGNVSMDHHMWKVRTKLLYYCKFGRTRRNGVVYISYASCINSFILGIHDPAKWKGQHYSARQFDKLTWSRDVKYLLKLPSEARHTWTDKQFSNFLQNDATHSMWKPMPKISPPRVLGSLRGFYSEHYTEKMKFLMVKAQGQMGEKALKMAFMTYLYSQSMKTTVDKVSVRKNRSMFAWLMARKALHQATTEGLGAPTELWDDASSTTGSTKSSMDTGSTTSGDKASTRSTLSSAGSTETLSSI